MDYSSTSVSASPPPPWLTVQNTSIAEVLLLKMPLTTPTQPCWLLSHNNSRVSDNPQPELSCISQGHKNHI